MHIVDELIAERARTLMSRPRLFKTIKPLLYKALHYRTAVELADTIKPLSGRNAFDRVAEVMAPRLNIDGLDNLPKDGACIIISNHPTGLADGIAVHHAIQTRRPQHLFLANADAKRVIPHCEDLIIPVEWVLSKRTLSKTRETLARTRQAFNEERCVVIFPSGKLAFMGWTGLIDKPWESSAAMLAIKYKVPVIPLRIKARNSLLYYFFEKTNGELRDITLFRELLNKKGQRFDLTFGRPIAPVELPKNAEAATAYIRNVVENL